MSTAQSTAVRVQFPQYKCVFKIHGARREVFDERGLNLFGYGFWVDEDYELARIGKEVYWIPPAAILYVEKIKES